MDDVLLTISIAVAGITLAYVVRFFSQDANRVLLRLPPGSRVDDQTADERGQRDPSVLIPRRI